MNYRKMNLVDHEGSTPGTRKTPASLRGTAKETSDFHAKNKVKPTYGSAKMPGSEGGRATKS
jgi:hypothetical protein